MPTAWFRLPEGDPPTDALHTDAAARPAYIDRDGVGAVAANRTHPDGAPHWVAHVRGTADALDAIAAEPDAVRYGSVPVDALNAMLDQTRDADGWQQGFDVSEEGPT